MDSKWIQDFDDYPHSQKHTDMNNEIVKALGWHIEELAEPEVLIVEPGTPGFPPEGSKIVSHLHIVDEDGNPVQRAWSSEANCWEHCPTPPFCQNLNYAMMLFEGVRIKLIIRHAIDNEWWVGYQYPSGSGNVYLPGSGSYYPMAEAVARAWLRWHEAQQYESGNIVWSLPNSEE
jgi:hypothetical protein